MLNILIVYAVKEERVLVQDTNCTFNYCITGVGKVAAALAVEKAIHEFHPDIILNIGTCGSVNFEVGTVHLCKEFIDRDMEKLHAFGVPYQENFSEELDHLGLLGDLSFDSVCNTGDTFLTSADGSGDVFDMESFAIARVCKKHKLPFMGIKCVTDIIGQNSVQHWEDKLAEANDILQAFVNEFTFGVPDNYQGSEVKSLITKYNLEEHPEGGWYKEMYRSNMLLKASGLPNDFGADRDALTSIYYLLTDNNYSAFHKIKSPEVWYFHQGIALLIHMIDDKGNYSCVELSNKESGVLQYTVEPNVWFAASIKGEFGYSLVSCAVAPGFDFRDFTLAKTEELANIAPDSISEINQFCIKEK